MQNWIKFGITLCLTTTILSGCSLGSGNEAINKEQSSTIKVMHYSEDAFHQEYGMLFRSLYPNIEIEVVNTRVIYDSLYDQYDQDYTKALEAYIEDEQPDVVIMESSSQVESLIEQGILYDLDSFIAQENYNAEGLIPGALDYMKSLGSGKVYTIPTSFRTQALFYNKDLFDQFSIPYPTDQMTWPEIISLAEQFPIQDEPKERLFGLRMTWSNDLTEIIDQLAAAEGVQFFNTDTLEMTMDTPAWANIIEQGMSILQSNILFYDDMLYSDPSFVESENGTYTNDPFLNGRLAIKLSDNHYIKQIEDAQMNAQVPEDIVQRWDLVTAPVSAQQPDSTTYSTFHNLVGINASSTNIDAAWTYISYITSDEYARVMSKVQYGNTPIRTNYFNKDAEHNVEALYKLKPIENPLYSLNHVPQYFLYEFSLLLQETFTKLTEGQFTIEQALAEAQLKGNELLAAAKLSIEEFEEFLDSNQDSTPGVTIN